MEKSNPIANKVKVLEVMGSELFRHQIELGLPSIEIGLLHYHKNSFLKLVKDQLARKPIMDPDGISPTESVVEEMVDTYLETAQDLYDYLENNLYTCSEDGTLRIIPAAAKELKSAGYEVLTFDSSFFKGKACIAIKGDVGLYVVTMRPEAACLFDCERTLAEIELCDKWKSLPWWKRLFC